MFNKNIQSDDYSPVQGTRWRGIRSISHFCEIVEGLIDCIDLGPCIDRVLILKICKDFFRSMVLSYRRCNVENIIEHNDAIKERVSEFQTHALELLKFQEESENYFFTFNEDGEEWTKGWKVNSSTYITFSNSVEDWTVQLWGSKRPQFVKHLYRLLYVGFNACLYNKRMTDQDNPFYTFNQIEDWVSFIITMSNFFNLYEDDRIIDELERKSFAKLTSEPEGMNEESFIHDLKLVFDDINISKDRYVSHIRRSLNRSFLRPYDPESDLYISTSKTGTSVGLTGRCISLPGILANAFEEDIVDEETKLFFSNLGYDSSYYDNMAELIDSSIREKYPKLKITQYGVKSMTIPQHKAAKRRVIHLACGPIQDRLSYFESIFTSILKGLPNDCTFDQDKGRSFVKRASMFAEQNKFSTYCLDISSATDTCSKKVQREIISLCFGDEAADAWHRLTNYERIFVFDNGERVKYNSVMGQPQGLKSSFSALALLHHFVMLVVMKRLNRENTPADQFYTILGDDSFLQGWETYPGEIRDMYIRTCKEIGWEVNPNKGHSFVFGEDTQCLTEFAKVLYLEGRTIQVMPLELARRCDTPIGMISMLLWRSSGTIARKEDCQMTNLIKRLGRKFPEFTKVCTEYIYALTSAKVGMFSNLKIPDEIQARISEDTKDTLIRSAYLTLIDHQLKRTVWESLIPAKDEKYHQVGDLSMDRRYIHFQKIAKLLGPCNKVNFVIERNKSIISYLNNLVHGVPELLCATALIKEFSEEELDLILNLIYYKDNIWDVSLPLSNDQYEVISEGMDTLLSKNPYSISRSGDRNSSILTETVERFNEIRNELSLRKMHLAASDNDGQVI